MRFTLLRFFALLALLLLGHLASYAQSGPHIPQRTVTGLGDPEPMDPRYAAAAEVAELKIQLHVLTKAYAELVVRHNEQAARMRELERKQAQPVSIPADASKQLRRSPPIGRY